MFICIKVVVFCFLFLSLIFIFNYLHLKSKSKEHIKVCGVMEIDERDSFYVHLLSNVESDQSYRVNTVANFTTKLAEKISFDEQWEVGLSEISYTKSWYNIKKNIFIDVFTSETGAKYGSHECYIRAGFYPSIDVLIDEINKQMKCLERGKLKDMIKRSPIIRYDPIVNRTYVQPGITNENKFYVYPSLNKELEQLLGFSFYENENYFSFFWNRKEERMANTQEIGLKKIIDYTRLVENSSQDHFVMELQSRYSVQFNVCDMHLLVYCSIIQPILVGNTYSKLLRQVEIPRDVRFGDQCVVRYLEPFYYPVLSQEIDTIEIHIKDDSNNTIPFDFGRSSITLHFRKKVSDDNKFVRKLLR